MSQEHDAILAFLQGELTKSRDRLLRVRLGVGDPQAIKAAEDLVLRASSNLADYIGVQPEPDERSQRAPTPDDVPVEDALRG